CAGEGRLQCLEWIIDYW
nr:immunoglobulin heavy chain junction region [Macaca mulatta]